jgi:hypothetical protein
MLLDVTIGAELLSSTVCISRNIACIAAIAKIATDVLGLVYALEPRRISGVPSLIETDFFSVPEADDVILPYGNR